MNLSKVFNSQTDVHPLSTSFPYFVSWSGGKDSCLSLYRAIQKYGQPSCLLNMLTEDGTRSRSHGLHKTVLERQAHSLQIPIRFYSATWDQYEATFLNALAELKKAGIQKGVFGDINISTPYKGTTNRQWADRICAKAHIAVDEPLWEDSTESILQAFLEAGFVAKIIATKAEMLGADYLGKILDADLIAAFTKMGIDPAGERGEYHTVVIDGPIFKEPLRLEERMRVFRDGCWFLDVF